MISILGIAIALLIGRWSVDALNAIDARSPQASAGGARKTLSACDLILATSLGPGIPEKDAHVYVFHECSLHAHQHVGDDHAFNEIRLALTTDEGLGKIVRRFPDDRLFSILECRTLLDYTR